MATKVLPESFSATASASFFCSRLLASSCERWDSKCLRFSSVARSAFFFGRRKLRAKPSFTLTTSPIWPSFSTRSSKITCMAASLHNVGQQRHESGALDRQRKQALFARGDRRYARGHDLAAFGYEPLQHLDVLVIDFRRIGAGKGTRLPPAE